MSQSRLKEPGQAYCSYSVLSRNDYLLNYIWRKAHNQYGVTHFYLASQTLTRHLISMEEHTFLQVITMGDVIDSTLMHINDLPRPTSTQLDTYLTPKRRKMTLYHYFPPLNMFLLISAPILILYQSTGYVSTDVHLPLIAHKRTVMPHYKHSGLMSMCRCVNSSNE